MYNCKDIIIIGDSSYAQLLRYYLEKENNENCHVIAYAVEKEYLSKSVAEDGLPIVPFENIENQFNVAEVWVVLGIGYAQMNKVRERLYNAVKDKGFRVLNYIHPSAVISKNVCLGDGNIILENVVIQPVCKIGNGNVLQTSAIISHDSEIGDFNFLAQRASISGRVHMGNNIFVGNNATIRNRVLVSSYSLIGAGAYVSKDLEEYSVIVPPRSVLLEKKSLDVKI